MDEILQLANEVQEKNKAAALGIIVRTHGSTPRHSASKIIVYPDGSFKGSVGGGEVEGRVIREALDSLKDGKTRLLSYKMVDPTTGDPGICGGNLDIYVEPIIPKPTLLVVGAGHVGKEVASLGKWLNFHVVVSDDREEFCNAEMHPDADSFLCVTMDKIPEEMEITPYTYIVLTTRGSSTDVAGLGPLLKTEPGYLGIIGSKKRWIETQKGLKNKGVDPEEFKGVNSPIGIDLGAETPREIALSILAEIMMAIHKTSGKTMKFER